MNNSQNEASKSEFRPFRVSAVRRKNYDGKPTNATKHDFYEMGYVKNGSGVFVFENTQIRVGPGDLGIIRPGCSHMFYPDEDTGCEWIVVYFELDENADSEILSTSAKEFLGCIEKRENSSGFTVKVPQKNQIVFCMERIMSEQENPGEDMSEEMRLLLMDELFILVTRILKAEYQYAISSDNGRYVKDQVVNIARKYIHDNFERSLTLNDVSNKVFLSPSYFTRVFKEATGYSPMSYLNKVRVERAKEMLATTNLKIRDISDTVGFGNQQRFNDMFRKYAGMTPMQYRRTARK